MEIKIMFGICIFMFLLFSEIGLDFCFSKVPVNFWAGEKISPEEVSDIKKYNRANGIMWIVYGILYLIPAATAFVSVLVSGLIIGVLTFIGCPVLIFIYTKKIRPKYVSKDF